MNRIVICIVLFIFVGCGRPSAPSNLAEVGNGGHGYGTGGNVYLVDLVEAGIERGNLGTEEEYPKKNNFAGLLRDGVRTNFVPAKSEFPYAAVGKKLHQLYLARPVFAMSLLEVIRMYQWNFIEHDLSRISLEGSVVSFQEGAVLLVANRRGRSIYVNLSAFRRMSDLNRAGLVLHEAIYALIKPAVVGGRTTQNAARVREITAHLLSRGEFSEPVEQARLEEIIGAAEFPGTHVSHVNNATFASHFAPSKYHRVMIFDPTLSLQGYYGATVFLHELKRYSDPEQFRDELTKWMTTASVRERIEIQLVFQSSNTERKGGLLFRFGEYEENGEIKTYVKPEALQTQVTLRLWDELAASTGAEPPSVEDIMARSWLAIMRAHPDLTPDVKSGAYPKALADRMFEVARSTDLLLPSSKFINYRHPKSDK